MEVLITAITILITSYLLALFFLHNIFISNIKTRKLINNYKNVLFIYPHPDDETMSSGALINHFAKSKKVKAPG